MNEGMPNVEAERQLAAAAERHREMLASMQELGRPEAGQHVAVKAVDRAVRLVCFALRRGAEAGIPEPRLVELTGWDPALVAQGIAQVDEPRFVARLVPAGIDRDEIEATAAGVKATARLASSPARSSTTCSATAREPRSPAISTSSTGASTRRGTTWRATVPAGEPA